MEPNEKTGLVKPRVALDSEYPQLSDNDVWLYQLELQHHIRVSTAGAGSRYQAMLILLCAQARRCNKNGD